MAGCMVTLLTEDAQHPLRHSLTQDSGVLEAGFKYVPGECRVDGHLSPKHSILFSPTAVTMSGGFLNDEACICQHLTSQGILCPEAVHPRDKGWDLL